MKFTILYTNMHNLKRYRRVAEGQSKEAVKSEFLDYARNKGVIVKDVDIVAIPQPQICTTDDCNNVAVYNSKKTGWLCPACHKKIKVVTYE